MRTRSLFVATAMLAVCSYGYAEAGLVGSTYDGTLASSSLVVSQAGTNPYTDGTANALSFCVNAQGGAGCGLQGVVSFTNPDANESDIVFTFSGNADGGAGDTFTVDLSNFITLDGSAIASVDQTLSGGSFLLTGFADGDASFTGTLGADGTVGAQSVTFGDALVFSPEPGSIALAFGGLAGVILAARRRRAN